MPFPSPLDLMTQLSLDPNVDREIQKHRAQIQEIMQRNSPLWALVVGPCSLHDTTSALDYARKLQALQKKVEKTCFLVMRAHVEKPRTCLGWKGLVYDPHLNGRGSIAEGLFISRSLYLEIAKLGVPIATEFLEPIVSSYFSDLISWGFIGARTSSSQIHRQLASSLAMPIGFKNSTDGTVESAIQSAVAAISPHHFIHIDSLGKVAEVSSPGNPFSHLVLRGTTLGPNYHSDDVEGALKLSLDKGLHQPLLIDCAHGNSLQKPFDQNKVCQDVLKQYLSGNEKIFGVMIESHLKSGNQSIITDKVDPEVSITDPCLNWEETEELILSVHETLLEASTLSLV